MTVSIHFADVTTTVRCRALDGEERLGLGFTLEALIEAEQPIAASDVLGRLVMVSLEGPHGDRRIAGVVRRWTAIATTRPEATRGYRVLIRPNLCRLELRRRSRVYRKMTAAAIVQQLLTEGGYPAAAVAPNLKGGHAEREYTVQYEETDAAFVQRMCEDDGLFLRFFCGDDAEKVAVEDDSRKLAEGLDAPLPLVDDHRMLSSERSAHHGRAVRRHRPGKVMLNDYDPLHPSLPLRVTALAEDASAAEQDGAVYAAPGGYKEASAADVRARYDGAGEVADPNALAGSGEARALLALEARRADARLCEIESNVMTLAPGLAFTLEPETERAGIPGGELVVVAVHHRYRFEEETHTLKVTTIPKGVPFRLPRVTPRPRIAGLQTAITTGASGEEIHTDALGNAFVRYLWDTDAPRDETSSLAIRTVQPNMPDSMLLPRVGWEVLMAHEDGDPERPFVMGRSYTAKMMPPFALPANKTVTSFATDSSPGAGGRNSIHIDDAAGREHLKIQATFNRATTVGDNMTTQTGNNERLSVTGNQIEGVGAQQVVSVGEALLTSLGSLTLNVGAFQKISVAGDFGTKVGNEVVIVGAAQIEQAGNPVKGALNLAFNKTLQVIGSTGLPGQVIAAGIGIGRAMAEGYMSGGPDGAMRAGKMAALGTGLGLLPGGEAAMTMISGSTQPNPWDHGRPQSGSAAPGGGAGGGASDSAAASGPGPGHRIVACSGFGLEVVHNFVVVTPGQIGWTTCGAAIVVTAASKQQKAATGTFRVLGLAVDSLGSRKLEVKNKLNRKSMVRASVAAKGALEITPASKYNFSAKSVTLDCGGTLTLGPVVTFKCGTSSIAASGSVVCLIADKIEFTEVFKQSGAMSHS